MQKKIHFYWGNSKMSWLRYMTISSFVRFNPDWEVILTIDKTETSQRPWSDENKQDFFNYEGKDYLPDVEKLNVSIREWSPEIIKDCKPKSLFENATFSANVVGDISLDRPKVPELSTPSHRSNFFKWYTLATEGGVYSDMDIVFTSPMGDFWESIKQHDATLCWQNGYYLIGFMASNGNSDLFKKIYQAAHVIFDSEKYQSVGQAALLYSIANNAHIQYTYENILQYFNREERIFLFEPDLLYPVSYEDIGLIFEEGGEDYDIPKSAVGLHWFGGCGPGQVFNNEINADNYRSRNCTLAKTLRLGEF